MKEATHAQRALAPTLARLQAEFPDARLTEVSFTLRSGERHDNDRGQSETWGGQTWNVQVGNETARGDSSQEAIANLRKEIAVNATIPQYAARIAAVLREIPKEGFVREHALMHARNILDNER